MAARCALSAPSCLVCQTLRGNNNKLGNELTPCLPSPRAVRVRVNAAKLPPGVEVPRVQPKLSEPFLGFTQTAEIWNSRACMMGLIGTFIVELVLNKGILQIIGVEKKGEPWKVWPEARRWRGPSVIGRRAEETKPGSWTGRGPHGTFADGQESNARRTQDGSAEYLRSDIGSSDS
ncbi:unnamed protein product [Urochloa humidicola]